MSCPSVILSGSLSSVSSVSCNLYSGKADHFAVAAKPRNQNDNPVVAIYKLINEFPGLHSEAKPEKIQELVKEGVKLFSSCTAEMMWNNQKEQEHPILHELVQQWLSTFELCKEVWKIHELKSFWDNDKYVDQYNLTVFQRLVSSNSDLPRRTDRDYSQDIEWMARELHVKPTERSHGSWGKIIVENFRL